MADNSLAMAGAAITGKAGHAVIFMAHAVPIAIAAPVDRDGRIRCGLTSQRRRARVYPA
jgi:hypothetical protein